MSLQLALNEFYLTNKIKRIEKIVIVVSLKNCINSIYKYTWNSISILIFHLQRFNSRSIIY